MTWYYFYSYIRLTFIEKILEFCQIIKFLSISAPIHFLEFFRLATKELPEPTKGSKTISFFLSLIKPTFQLNRREIGKGVPFFLYDYFLHLEYPKHLMDFCLLDCKIVPFFVAFKIFFIRILPTCQQICPSSFSTL